MSKIAITEKEWDKFRAGSSYQGHFDHLLKSLLPTAVKSTKFYQLSSVISMSHPHHNPRDELTVGSPSISNHPDTASHVSPVWWPHRPSHVQTVPRIQRRTRWMEGCTLSTGHTWVRLSSWWTTWGGVSLSPKLLLSLVFRPSVERVDDCLFCSWIYLTIVNAKPQTPSPEFI